MNMYRYGTPFACVASVCFTATLATGNVGVSEFYITNAGGEVYSVDGSTLSATRLFTMDSAAFISDLYYLGDHQIVAHNGGVFTQYDTRLDDGTGTLLYDLRPLFDPGINFANGIDYDDQGRVHFSIQSFSPDNPSAAHHAMYDPLSGIYTRMSNYDQPRYFLDVHQVEDNIFFGAHYNTNSAIMYDSTTGITLNAYDLGFGLVSMFDIGNQTIAIGKEGGVYSFDPIDGTTEFIGNITRAGDSIIGATIPSPGGLIAFGFASVICTRRRR